MFSGYALTLALLAFFSTGVDDFCVLFIFFSTEYGKYRDGLSDPKCQSAFIAVSIGQLVGFTLIIGVSLAMGIGLSKAVDEEYIDLIGFIPVVIGFYQIYELLTEFGYVKPCCASTENREEAIEESEKRPLISNQIKEHKPKSWKEGNGQVTIAEPGNDTRAVKATKYNESEDGDLESTEVLLENYTEKNQVHEHEPIIGSWMTCFMSPLALEVMLFALIFGLDNISVYTVLFGELQLPTLLKYMTQYCIITFH